MIRSGLIMKKIGMTRLFNEDGKHIPVTVLFLDKMQVLCQKTEEKDGYSALQVGAGTKKNPKKPQGDFYKKIGIDPKQKVLEFRVTSDAIADVGTEFSVTHFVSDQYVDVIGTSIGKGFAGGMKRHNFSGLRATHGVSLSHRSIGSTGNRTDPGRTFKNRKMAGHLGHSRVTVQNLKIVKIDSDRDIIFIKGGVPGHKNGWVIVKDSIKKSLPDGIKPFVDKGSFIKSVNSDSDSIKNIPAKEL